MKKLVQILCALLCTTALIGNGRINQAVTYELSPGRFGDNLISYIHAKWIAYKYNLPLLYKPFVHSDELLIHERELHYNKYKHLLTRSIRLGTAMTPDLNQISVLFVVPYFPDSSYEQQHGVSFTCGAWEHFAVDWQDKKFIQLLRTIIQPRGNIPSIEMPKDRITIALHMRKGGNHDTPETIQGFPLKFLPETFYFDHLKYISAECGHKPLYVHLFTDDNDPAAIVERGMTALQGYDIIWNWRRNGNNDTTHVVEDFFLLQQFDCLMHSESNYSFVASKLGNYMLSLFADSFHKEGTTIIYDHIAITKQKSS